MRCKRHTVDFSSTIGVCASCLRERLLSLAASAAATAAVEDTHRQSRKSNNNRRFIAAPQVELGYSCKDFESNRTFKSKEGKCSNLFRTRSDPRFSCDSSESSSVSCVSTIISGGHRKKQPATACCIGISPARYTENEHEPPSETMEESPGRLRKTPARQTPGRRKVATGSAKNISGMGFCLKPLVRANPNCNFPRKNKNSGEITKSATPHITATTSFGANRSKKLVDLGRVDRCR